MEGIAKHGVWMSLTKLKLKNYKQQEDRGWALTVFEPQTQKEKTALLWLRSLEISWSVISAWIIAKKELKNSIKKS